VSSFVASSREWGSFLGCGRRRNKFARELCCKLRCPYLAGSSLNWPSGWTSTFDWPTEGAILLLLFMFVCSVGLVIKESRALGTARKQFRFVIKSVSEAFHSGKADRAVSAAQTSHTVLVGNIAGAWLAESSLPLVLDSGVFGIERDLEHSALAIRARLTPGQNLLATISATAPFIGVFGTVMHIITSTFRGCGAPPSVCNAATASAICDALWVTALGLFVALPTFWCYKYFASKIQELTVEMEHSMRKLVSDIIIHSPTASSRALP
jgi:biopolymer transport protein ExbB/TolQ